MHHGNLRNGSVDVFRLMSSAGIVWFHAHADGKILSYSALSVFFVFLIVLPLNSNRSIFFKAFVWGRTDRLLRPWLIWSAIYAILKIAQAWSNGTAISNEFDNSMLLIGTQQHLWFLPFGYACSIIAFAILRRVSVVNPLPFAFALLLAGVSLPVSRALLETTLRSPLTEWVYAIPAVMFACTIYLSDLKFGRLLFTLATLAFSFLITLQISSTAGSSLSLVLGVALSILAFQVKIPSTALTKGMAMVSMPIYLMHPIFLSFGSSLIQQNHTAVAALIAFSASAILGALIVRFGWARWLF